MEARIALSLKDYIATQYGMVTSLEIGLFAVLMTVLVIFFALRTKEAAVTEAQRGVKDLRDEAGQLLQRFREESENARGILQSIINTAHVDAEAISHIRVESQFSAASVAQRLAAKEPLTDREAETLGTESRKLLERIAGQLSPSDYYLLTARYIEAKDWRTVKDLAAAMRLRSDAPELECAGYFYEGTALKQLGLANQSIETHSDALVAFGNSTDPKVLFHVARCRNNLSVSLTAANRGVEALEVIEAAVVALSALPAEQARDLGRKLLINKANTLSRLGRNEEALPIYDGVIADLKTDGEMQDPPRLAHAYFNKGCVLALLERANEAVQCLDISRAIAVTPYTEDYDGERDFDPIRSHPTFLGFLKRHGLDGTPSA